MKELIIGLILWINQNSGFNYDVNAGLPHIQRVDSDALVSLYFNDEIPKFLSKSDIDSIKGNVAAIYRPDHVTVYLGDNINLDSEYGRSALVHELVHFVQYMAGQDKQVACVKELEHDAYDVQAKYMKSHDVEPDFDAFTVRARSMCAYYH